MVFVSGLSVDYYVESANGGSICVPELIELTITFQFQRNNEENLRESVCWMQLNFINFKHSEYQIICKPSLVFLILSAGKVNKKEISLLETEWICICKSRLEHFPLLSREFSFVCAQVKTLNNIKYLIQWLFPSCQLQWEFKIENHELKTFLNVIEKTFSYHPLKLTLPLCLLFQA